MSFSTQYSAHDFDGNGSTVTAYPVSFPAQSPDDVWVAVKPEGADVFTTLARSAFTVVELGGGAFEVRTAAAWSAEDTVKILRLVNYDQLFSFSEGGPLPVGEIGRALDRIVMQVQRVRLEAGLEGSTITLPDSALAVYGMAVFSNSAARTAATPAYTGQLGIQVDTGAGYFGVAATAGQWAPLAVLAKARVFASLAALLASTPDFDGQLAKVAVSAAEAERNLFFIATGTGAGNWAEPRRQLFAGQWEVSAWRADEALIPGQRRWAGNIPREMRVESVFLSCDTPGTGAASVHLYRTQFPSATPTFTGAPIALTAADCGSAILTRAGLLSGYAAEDSNLDARDRIEIEIITAGNAVTVGTSGGSGVSTPSGGGIVNLTTGTQIHSPTHGDAFIVFNKGDGTVVVSSPAATTATTGVNSGRIIFVRGIGNLTLVSGDTVVPVDDTTVGLVRVGDYVSGPTVPPETVITSVNPGAGRITLSQPVTGDTSLIAVVNPVRPPVQHFTAISAAATATTITLPVTTKIKVGDVVLGENIPAGTYVTAVGSSTVNLSAPIEAGGIVEATIGQPTRTATATAGHTSATLNAGTGIRIGAKIEGSGVLSGTYVTGISGTTVSFSKPVNVALSAETWQFTRQEIQVTGTIPALNAEVTLPYAASATEVEVGMLVHNTAFPPGTVVAGMAGSVVTMSRSAIRGAFDEAFLFTPPGDWRGLRLTILGKFVNPYP